MQHNGKANVAYLLRHVATDPFPLTGGTLHTVNAAVVLLVETVRPERMQANTVRIVSILGVLVRQEVGCDSFIERRPGGPSISCFKHAPSAHAEIHVLRVARIDINRVHARAVGRPLLAGAAPLVSHRMTVESLDAVPGV